MMIYVLIGDVKNGENKGKTHVLNAGIDFVEVSKISDFNKENYKMFMIRCYENNEWIKIYRLKNEKWINFINKDQARKILSKEAEIE